MQLLFEVSQALYDATDFINIKDDNNRQTAHLISRFVEMVPKFHLRYYEINEFFLFCVRLVDFDFNFYA